MRTTSMVLVLFVLACGCGAPTTTTQDAGAADGAKAPVLDGSYAFLAKRVQFSTQTSGGGAMPGDNLSIFITDGCTGFGDRSVTLGLFSLDHRALTPGVVTIERSTATTSASVSYSASGASQNAVSGTVTMEVVDFQTLSNNRGSFNVRFYQPDGGVPTLSGTFDGRYLCQ